MDDDETAGADEQAILAGAAYANFDNPKLPTAEGYEEMCDVETNGADEYDAIAGLDTYLLTTGPVEYDATLAMGALYEIDGAAYDNFCVSGGRYEFEMVDTLATAGAT